MKKQFLKSIQYISSLALVAAIVFACQNEGDNITPEQAQARTEKAAQDNSQIMAATQEIMDITSDALIERGVTDGRSATNGKKRHHYESGCKPSISGTFDLDRSHPDTIIYSGSITIDFGDGSTCKDSTRVRTGKIKDTFIYIFSFKDSITFSASQTITFEGFSKDTVKIDGTFITKCASGQPSTIEIQDAKITYPDGTFTTWSGMFTITRFEGEDHADNDEGEDHNDNDNDDGDDDDDNDRDTGGKKITGSISGTTRDGIPFSSEITKEIIYKNSCRSKHNSVPVSGTIDVTVGGVVSTVDYGDGTCDKTYTITTGGETKEYTFEHRC